MSRALILILLAAAYRLLVPILGIPWNFAPLMALAFCGGLYLPRRSAYLVPLAALLLSDLVLNAYYGEPLLTSYLLIAGLCYAAASALGKGIARKKSWILILGGTLANCVLFYVATNTWAWIADPAYSRFHLGWWQALTTGLPGFPPTWLFFRNSLLSDLAFTAVTVAVCKSRWPAANLFRRTATV